MTISPQRPEVLIVDDEVQIRRLLRFTLEDAGYDVREAETDRGGLVEFAHHRTNLVVLDLGLPDVNGIEVLRRLREWSEIPVLILSVFAQEGSKIAALDAGADDYLTKPFGGGELLARVRALLRRAKGTEAPPVSLSFGKCSIDFVRRQVTRESHAVKLTMKEYELLRFLAAHHDKILTHQQILENVWSSDARANTHYLRVFMMRLRRKLEDDPDNPRYLQTESGIGYRLVAEGV